MDKRYCGLWYKIEEASSRFFFANSQQTKCTEKLVVHMYDKSWNAHATEFDIVKDGNVSLLVSLPQMGHLGFQLEFSPQKSFLNCTRLGIWKRRLRMSKGAHVVMDFQDIAWYMSAVYFKTPELQSSFVQQEHFEYSQLFVETFSFGNDDDWEILPQERSDPSPRHFVANYLRLKVPKVQFLLVISNLFELLSWR